MSSAVLTNRERAAVQAYLRLLHTVRATFDEPSALVPPGVLAEAEHALAEAGLAGNEGELFRLLGEWCPDLAPPAGA
jgi:hypothetical protein